MRPFLTLLLLLICATASAQPRERTLRTDTGTVVMRYFTSGQVSTKEWRDKDDRWGRSWAFRKNGEVIFEGQTRRFAGHASVHFSYHPNGAVSKVETSDAPDGGIQWHRSTTTFDDQGNRTGFWEDGRDNYGPIPRPNLRIITEPDAPPPSPKQEVAICQRMFVNELIVVNPTKAACRVVATAKHPSPAMPGGTWTLAPGDTVRIGTYSMGESWPEWKDHVDLAIHEVVLGNRKHAVARIRTDEAKVSAEHRRLFVVIEGWTAAKGPEREEPPPGRETPSQKKKRRWLFFR